MDIKTKGENEMRVNFKVASKTDVGKLAGAITEVTRQGDDIAISAVGAGAVNQVVKAVAKARGYLAPTGIDIVIIPSFKNFNDDEIGEERTAIVMEVRKI